MVQDDTTIKKSISQTSKMDHREDSSAGFDNENGFDGSVMLYGDDARTELPHMLSDNFSVPIWKIIGKFIT